VFFVSSLGWSPFNRIQEGKGSKSSHSLGPFVESAQVFKHGVLSIRLDRSSVIAVGSFIGLF